MFLEYKGIITGLGVSVYYYWFLTCFRKSPAYMCVGILYSYNIP